jgi:uncharacterized protein (TIGR02246 family)
MVGEQKRYLSYLLRLWQAGSESGVVWRASLQSPHTGERTFFSSLEALLTFLREQTDLVSDPDGELTTQPPRALCGTSAEREIDIMAKNKTAAEAVPEILQSYGDTLMAGDLDRWIQNWTDDGVQLPPGAPMNVGKQMIYESMSAWFDAYTASDLKMIGDMEIQEMGDWAFSRVSASYKVTPKDGSPPFVNELKALTIYQRQSDGAWKIHRDCFNSNVSP